MASNPVLLSLLNKLCPLSPAATCTAKLLVLAAALKTQVDTLQASVKEDQIDLSVEASDINAPGRQIYITWLTRKARTKLSDS